MIIVSALFTLAGVFVAKDLPLAVDDRVEITLVARDPDIVTPTGIAVDGRGRIFVIESHTHFPPKDYAGPKTDRIRLLVDADGDGQAESVGTFFEGTSATMNMGFGPNGNLYVATRMEVFVLEGAARLDIAGPKKTLVKLETQGNYPHNGLSGFAFDVDGNIWFGLGENLGAAYELVGTDGKVLAGGGEGGSVYTCRADGSNLHRVATGFWNPFHLYRDPFGQLFAVDNDPDARPPCRLLHVVEGGDYGFRFRHGRNGLHPFHAWNGELPGTLGMIAGTGEAPCAVLGGLAGKGWPADYADSLLVTSWGDHRIERFPLELRGATFRATMRPVVAGGENFRPVGLAVGKPGELFVSDWVDKSYEVHGKGRVWRLRFTSTDDRRSQAEALASWGPESVRFAKQEAARMRTADVSLLNGFFFDLPGLAQGELLRRATPDYLSAVMGRLGDLDPFLRQAARHSLQELASADEIQTYYQGMSGMVRQELLLALRDKGGAPPIELLRTALTDSDPVIRLIAVQWIGDQKLTDARAAVDKLLSSDGPWTRELFASTLATLELLERGWSTPNAGSQFAVQLLDKPSAPPTLVRFALRVVPPDHEWLTRDRYRALAFEEDEGVAIEAVRSLREGNLPQKIDLLTEVAHSEDRPSAVRVEALLGIAAFGDAETKTRLLDAAAQSNDPILKETAAAIRLRDQSEQSGFLAKDATLDEVFHLVDGSGNRDRGERLFFDPGGPGCFRCHQVEGRGGAAGPELTGIGRSLDRNRLIESILAPSKEVAPMYVPWMILTDDGRSRLGLLVREGLAGEQFYVDRDGKEFHVLPTEIEERRSSAESLMPAGLLTRCTPTEVRDLIAFLEESP